MVESLTYFTMISVVVMIIQICNLRMVIISVFMSKTDSTKQLLTLFNQQHRGYV